MAPAPTLPKGSLILVTGASGYIGSHIINEALQAGYKVRGTARSEEKTEKTKTLFKHHADYTTVVVPDFQHEGAFDQALKGCDAVIHVASDTTFGSNPDEVVKPTVQGVLSILRSAAKTPSVKRFVLTSSSVAAYDPKPGKEMKVTAESWNQDALDQAYAPPPYTPERAYAVYSASKTEGEQALWKFVKDEKPHFVVNAVLPNLNTGRILSSPGATGTVVPGLFKGELPIFGQQYQIDVVDDARIHLIAAVMDESLSSERIFAFAVVYTWGDMIAAIKELYPDAKSVATPPENELRDLAQVPNELGAELLKKWYGQDGYKSLKQSIKENLEESAGGK